MDPLVVLAAWSVLSVPAALVVGALLGRRPLAQPEPIPVRVSSSSTTP